MKNCTKCKLLKPLSEYHNTSRTKDGKMGACKVCRNTYNKAKAAEIGHDVLYARAVGRNPDNYKARSAAYYEKNKEIIKARSIAWSADNKDRKAATNAKHYQENKDAYFKSAEKWVEANPEKRKQVARDHASRYRIDPANRPIIVARKLVSRVMELTSARAKRRTFEELGYSRKDLEAHIAKQFTDGMAWDNHGDWHIDHIIPVSEMVRLGVTNPKKINALTNLRPMWATENLSKGAGFDLSMQVAIER